MVNDIFDLSGIDQDSVEGRISRRQNKNTSMVSKSESSPKWGDGGRVTKIMTLLKHMEKENLIDITVQDACKVMRNSPSSATVLLSTSNKFKRVGQGVYELLDGTPEEMKETVPPQPTTAPKEEESKEEEELTCEERKTKMRTPEPKKQKMEKNTARIVKPIKQILHETKEEPTLIQTTKEAVALPLITITKYHCPHCGKEIKIGDD